MQDSRHIDYIIVGQGLAGSAVAVQLLKRGRKILVIDQPDKNRASRIAAGLFNPVTGKKMVKTWLADTIFPSLHKFYPEVENKTGQHFFYSTPLYRPFVSIEEQNEWMGRSAEGPYTEYISKVFVKPSAQGVHDPFGGLLLNQCGYIHTTGYINAVRSWIQRDGFYWEQDFNEDQVSVQDDGIEYNDWFARCLILCQGVENGKWFDWLPVRPLKGETLTISSPFRLPYIVNRGVYVIPTGNANEWRVGATYDFQNSGAGITTEGKNELENKLRGIVQVPFETIGQDWGLRPTVPDRRPILGRHPEYKNIAVFNGLGTKGVSLAPYFSEVLIRSLENDGSINDAVDVNRYKSVYWKVHK